MTIKELWVGTSGWLRSQKLSRLSMAADYQPEIDDEGLISQEEDSADSAVEEYKPIEPEDNQIIVKAVPPMDKQSTMGRPTAETLEKLQEGFNKLVEQLQGINKNLNRQITQHENLMSHIEQLPQLLESFPAVVENQKRITEQLLEQLRATAAKDQQFIDAVEKIPTETAKQTDALVNIDHQLAAAADTDVQMTESLNKFNQTLDKLNQSTLGQTDSIIQMSKTFATSDRYLKYIISRQNKRFMWIFISAVSVCLAVILILTAVIIYVRS